ncbi:MAG TPA: aminotransferase class I/II-fold pyridoxal phosphate-dependent enzyme [Gemmatirosa sp.]
MSRTELAVPPTAAPSAPRPSSVPAAPAPVAADVAPAPVAPAPVAAAPVAPGASAPLSASLSAPEPASAGGIDPLRGSFAEFARPTGPDLIARTAAIAPWIAARRAAEVWPYARAVAGGVGPVARAEGAQFAPGMAADAAAGATYVDGLNFATQDYLSLAAHPAVLAAAADALARYGVHSGGSGALQGRSAPSRALERELAATLQMEHVVLFSSGWGAAFAAVTALVRPDDHVVMDRLAHASLQAGAQAATPNVTRVEHLSVPALERALAQIRATDARHGILVLTEGLFSMDADSPDLRAMQAVCRAYQATLLVDAAHDFGALGPGGTGHVGRSGLLGEVDLVMGAFSKTFAANGGFVATRSAGVRAYLEAYGGPYTFSNALSPLQVAVVRQALAIVRGPEGDARRARLLANVGALRTALAAHGLECLGEPAAVVPVLIGHTPLARLASGGVLRRGLFANLVEFPAVGVRAARFRLQVQADHTAAQAHEAAARLAAAVAEARHTLAARRGRPAV